MVPIRVSQDDARKRYDEMKRNPASLDLTRGKPSSEQLDLSTALSTVLGSNDYRAADGTDCRNYGGLDGLPEMRALFGELLDVPAENVMAADNSSLALMYETMAHAVLHGVPDGTRAWREQGPRFLCPSPGYDRHFSICEDLGIEMLTVGMTPEGPDVDAAERLAAADERIKGMWIVPKYGNPTGITLSANVVRRLAQMKTAAPDFRIMWDNAYAVHDLTDPPETLANALSESQALGHANRFWIYASFSKVTFAGAGVAAMASSAANVGWMRKHHANVTIGPDKLNQLRHVRFLRDAAGVRTLMRKHAAILRPKFEVVQRVLDRELGGTGLATWTRPRGGYFVSLDTQPGRAERVVKMAADAGVKLTPAGSAFPYKKDPQDRNIRIAPSFPSLKDLERAMEVLALSVRCASGE
ncbi:MAG TPA: aminotransferase class I/II-fold pyridoxal phosphate-dependent enzyme [Polyangiaceae bacterium]|nr:aminotransferase class I/II-fold pyridoxal phosphate-dependent enzyme [Polyangiaceae bacterium]